MKNLVYYFHENIRRLISGRLLKSTGKALYTLGRNIVRPEELIEDRLVPSLRSVPHEGRYPDLINGGFVAPNAVVVGNVSLGNKSSLWYGAQVRGDRGEVKIGNFSVLQDRVQVDPAGGKVEIGDHATIGPNCLLMGCVVEGSAFVGMGSTLRPGCVIKRGGVVAGGSVVEEGSIVEGGDIWAGNPARLLRKVTAAERAAMRENHQELVELAEIHR